MTETPQWLASLDWITPLPLSETQAVALGHWTGHVASYAIDHERGLIWRRIERANETLYAQAPLASVDLELIGNIEDRESRELLARFAGLPTVPPSVRQEHERAEACA